jgi:hypothetical protein
MYSFDPIRDVWSEGMLVLQKVEDLQFPTEVLSCAMIYHTFMQISFLFIKSLRVTRVSCWTLWKTTVKEVIRSSVKKYSSAYSTESIKWTLFAHVSACLNNSANEARGSAFVWFFTKAWEYEELCLHALVVVLNLL